MYILFINVKYIFQYEYVLYFLELFKYKLKIYEKCQGKCCYVLVAAQWFC